jgi:hypothetical protein
VEITYLPSDPSFATLQKPNDQIVFLILAPVIVSAIAGLIASAKLEGS